MTERIEKLAEQAGLWNDMEPTRREGRYAGYMNVSDVEKFAELIVQECISICLDKERPNLYGVREVEEAIKKHFGVEE